MTLGALAGRLRAELAAARRELVDALYPPACRLCGRLPAPCGACSEHALPAGPEPRRCVRCALRIAHELPAGSVCAGCRRRAPAFGRTLVLGDYHAEAGLRAWILALKHGGRRDLAEALGRRLAEQAQGGLGGAGLAGSLLVPVPLHALRRFERGYDQAWCLARSAARAGGAEAVCGLRRARWTPPQGSPGSRSRRANVHGAFRLRRGAQSRLAGRSVWLVDDVLTSGATASACARALLRGGAREVGVLALARVDLQGSAERALVGPVER